MTDLPPLPEPAIGYWGDFTADQMRAYAAAAVAAEREQCARLCDQIADDDNDPAYMAAAGNCAHAIRARSQP